MTFAVLLTALFVVTQSHACEPVQTPAAATQPAESTESDLYLNLAIPDLKKAVPALSGLHADADQERLPQILQSVARTIDAVAPKMPDVVSREEVVSSSDAMGPGTPRSLLNLGPRSNAMPSQSLGGSPPQSQEFRYLIQFHRTQEGSVNIEESRTDSKGQPLDVAQSGSRLSSGFTSQWLLFSEANQPEFRFRYLGEQQVDGRKTFAIAFAQVPSRVKSPSRLASGGKQAEYFYQGVVWVDEANSEIAMLRTDLLTPLRSLHLEALTTELHFHSVRIHGLEETLWLPNAVHIAMKLENSMLDENHRYSDYHLYHSTAKIVLTP
jgi:hypothetical protein